MKNAFNALMDFLGGAKPATPGNPAAVPVIPPTPAVGRDKWQARFWFSLGFLPALALVLCLMFLGISSLWKDADIRLPSWGSSVQAATPTNSIPETEVLPPMPAIKIDMRDKVTHNVGNDNDNSSRADIHIYPHAKEIPRQIGRENLHVGANTSRTVKIPSGATIDWSVSSSVKIEWQDQDNQWHTYTNGERPALKAVKFSTGSEPAEIGLYWKNK